MISIAMYFSLWVGTCTLAWTYGNNGYPDMGWGLLVGGIIWTLGLQRRWMLTADLALILFTLAAAVGIYLSLPFGWMLTGNLGALITHDIGGFVHRLDGTIKLQDTRILARAHTARLGMFLLISITLSLVAILWQTQISFEWMVIFVLVVVWGLSRVLRWLTQTKP